MGQCFHLLGFQVLNQLKRLFLCFLNHIILYILKPHMYSRCISSSIQRLSPALLLLTGKASTTGGLAIGATAASGIAVAGASGGISSAKACLSSFYIIAFMSSINAPLISSKVQFSSCCCCSISSVCSTGVVSKQSELIG